MAKLKKVTDPTDEKIPLEVDLNSEQIVEGDGIVKEGVEVQVGETAEITNKLEINIKPADVESFIDFIKKDSTKEEISSAILSKIENKKKIRLLIPIFGENIGTIIDDTYKYFPDYVGFIERKATRLGNQFAEYVG